MRTSGELVFRVCMLLLGQDVLREKQHHIEQLLKERDLENAEFTRAANHAEKVQQKLTTLKAEYEHYRLECEKKLNEFTGALAQLNIDRQSILSQLDDEKRRNEDLQFRFEEAAITKGDVEVVNQTNKHKIIALEKQLAAERLKSDQLETESSKLFEAEEALVKSRDEIESLKSNLDKVVQKRDVLQVEHQTSTETATFLKHQLETTKTALDNLQRQSSKQIDELKLNVATSRTDKFEIEKELSNYKDKLKDRSSSCEIYHQEITSLKEELSLVKLQLTKKTTESHTEESSLRIEVERLKAELLRKDTELQSKDQLLVTKTDELRSLKALLETTQIDLNAKSVDIERYQRSKQDAEIVFNKEIEYLKKTLKEKITEREEIEKTSTIQITQKNAEIAEATKTISSHVSEIQRLRKDLNEAKVSLERNSIDVHERHTRQIAIKESELMELAAELQLKKEELTKCSIVTTKLEDDICAKNGIIDKLQLEFDSLKKQCQMDQISAAEYTKRITELQLTNGDLQRKLSSTEEVINDLKEQKRRLEQELQSVITSAGDYSSELRKLNAAVLEKEQMIATVRDEYLQKLQHSQGIEQQLQLQLLKVNEDSKRTIATLEEQIKTVQQTEQMLRDQCTASNAEAVKIREELMLKVNQLQSVIEEKEFASKVAISDHAESKRYLTEQLERATGELQRTIDSCKLKIDEITAENMNTRNLLTQKSQELIESEAKLKHVTSQFQINEGDLRRGHEELVKQIQFDLGEKSALVSQYQTELELLKRDCQNRNINVVEKDHKISELSAQLEDNLKLITQLQNEKDALQLSQVEVNKNWVTQNQQCTNLLNQVAILTEKVELGQKFAEELQMQKNIHEQLLNQLKLTEQQKRELIARLESEVNNNGDADRCVYMLELAKNLQASSTNEYTQKIAELQKVLETTRLSLTDSQLQVNAQKEEILRLQNDMLKGQLGRAYNFGPNNTLRNIQGNTPTDHPLQNPLFLQVQLTMIKNSYFTLMQKLIESLKINSQLVNYLESAVVQNDQNQMYTLLRDFVNFKHYMHALRHRIERESYKFQKMISYTLLNLHRKQVELYIQNNYIRQLQNNYNSLPTQCKLIRFNTNDNIDFELPTNTQIELDKALDLIKLKDQQIQNLQTYLTSVQDNCKNLFSSKCPQGVFENNQPQAPAQPCVPKIIVKKVRVLPESCKQNFGNYLLPYSNVQNGSLRPIQNFPPYLSPSNIRWSPANNQYFNPSPFPYPNEYVQQSTTPIANLLSKCREICDSDSRNLRTSSQSIPLFAGINRLQSPVWPTQDLLVNFLKRQVQVLAAQLENFRGQQQPYSSVFNSGIPQHILGRYPQLVALLRRQINNLLLSRGCPLISPEKEVEIDSLKRQINLLTTYLGSGGIPYGPIIPATNQLKPLLRNLLIRLNNIKMLGPQPNVIQPIGGQSQQPISETPEIDLLRTQIPNVLRELNNINLQPNSQQCLPYNVVVQRIPISSPVSLGQISPFNVPKILTRVVHVPVLPNSGTGFVPLSQPSRLIIKSIPVYQSPLYAQGVPSYLNTPYAPESTLFTTPGGSRGVPYSSPVIRTVYLPQPPKIVTKYVIQPCPNVPSGVVPNTLLQPEISISSSNPASGISVTQDNVTCVRQPPQVIIQKVPQYITQPCRNAPSQIIVNKVPHFSTQPFSQAVPFFPTQFTGQYPQEQFKYIPIPPRIINRYIAHPNGGISPSWPQIHTTPQRYPAQMCIQQHPQIITRTVAVPVPQPPRVIIREVPKFMPPTGFSYVPSLTTPNQFGCAPRVVVKVVSVPKYINLPPRVITRIVPVAPQLVPQISKIDVPSSPIAQTGGVTNVISTSVPPRAIYKYVPQPVPQIVYQPPKIITKVVTVPAAPRIVIKEVPRFIPQPGIRYVQVPTSTIDDTDSSVHHSDSTHLNVPDIGVVPQYQPPRIITKIVPVPVPQSPQIITVPRYISRGCPKQQIKYVPIPTPFSLIKQQPFVPNLVTPSQFGHITQPNQCVYQPPKIITRTVPVPQPPRIIIKQVPKLIPQPCSFVTEAPSSVLTQMPLASDSIVLGGQSHNTGHINLPNLSVSPRPELSQITPNQVSRVCPREIKYVPITKIVHIPTPTVVPKQEIRYVPVTKIVRVPLPLPPRIVTQELPKVCPRQEIQYVPVTKVVRVPLPQAPQIITREVPKFITQACPKQQIQYVPITKVLPLIQPRDYVPQILTKPEIRYVPVTKVVHVPLPRPPQVITREVPKYISQVCPQPTVKYVPVPQVIPRSPRIVPVEVPRVCPQQPIRYVPVIKSVQVPLPQPPRIISQEVPKFVSRICPKQEVKYIPVTKVVPVSVPQPPRVITREIPKFVPGICPKQEVRYIPVTKTVPVVQPQPPRIVVKQVPILIPQPYPKVEIKYIPVPSQQTRPNVPHVVNIPQYIRSPPKIITKVVQVAVPQPPQIITREIPRFISRICPTQPTRYIPIVKVERVPIPQPPQIVAHAVPKYVPRVCPRGEIKYVPVPQQSVVPQVCAQQQIKYVPITRLVPLPQTPRVITREVPKLVPQACPNQEVKFVPVTKRVPVLVPQPPQVIIQKVPQPYLKTVPVTVPSAPRFVPQYIQRPPQIITKVVPVPQPPQIITRDIPKFITRTGPIRYVPISVPLPQPPQIVEVPRFVNRVCPKQEIKYIPIIRAVPGSPQIITRHLPKFIPQACPRQQIQYVPVTKLIRVPQPPEIVRQFVPQNCPKQPVQYVPVTKVVHVPSPSIPSVVSVPRIVNKYVPQPYPVPRYIYQPPQIVTKVVPQPPQVITRVVPKVIREPCSQQIKFVPIPTVPSVQVPQIITKEVPRYVQQPCPIRNIPIPQPPQVIVKTVPRYIRQPPTMVPIEVPVPQPKLITRVISTPQPPRIINVPQPYPVLQYIRQPPEIITKTVPVAVPQPPRVVVRQLPCPASVETPRVLVKEVPRYVSVPQSQPPQIITKTVPVVVPQPPQILTREVPKYIFQNCPNPGVSRVVPQCPDVSPRVIVQQVPKYIPQTCPPQEVRYIPIPQPVIGTSPPPLVTGTSVQPLPLSDSLKGDYPTAPVKCTPQYIVQPPRVITKIAPPQIVIREVPKYINQPISTPQIVYKSVPQPCAQPQIRYVPVAQPPIIRTVPTSNVQIEPRVVVKVVRVPQPPIVINRCAQPLLPLRPTQQLYPFIRPTQNVNDQDDVSDILTKHSGHSYFPQSPQPPQVVFKYIPLPCPRLPSTPVPLVKVIVKQVPVSQPPKVIVRKEPYFNRELCPMVPLPRTIIKEVPVPCQQNVNVPRYIIQQVPMPQPPKIIIRTLSSPPRNIIKEVPVPVVAGASCPPPQLIRQQVPIPQIRTVVKQVPISQPPRIIIKTVQVPQPPQVILKKVVVPLRGNVECPTPNIIQVPVPQPPRIIIKQVPIVQPPQVIVKEIQPYSSQATINDHNWNRSNLREVPKVVIQPVPHVQIKYVPVPTMSGVTCALPKLFLRKVFVPQAPIKVFTRVVLPDQLQPIEKEIIIPRLPEPITTVGIGATDSKDVQIYNLQNRLNACVNGQGGTPQVEKQRRIIQVLKNKLRSNTCSVYEETRSPALKVPLPMMRLITTTQQTPRSLSQTSQSTGLHTIVLSALHEAFSYTQKALSKCMNALLIRQLDKAPESGTSLRTQPFIEDNHQTEGQIEFLNSIIVDMQRKNEEQRARIRLLESGFSPAAVNDLDLLEQPSKTRAPRVYCDICEIFDDHETEDCPLQATDAGLVRPPRRNKRAAPTNRPYCEICELFGHCTEDCTEQDQTF
ncbi:uncharacterized protein LOC116176432 [Photinus pyralis]|uniref:uncharacterized protein LOC116176432 n=1 Tax=Photinus pyralis TaxID=7054 RepID=UPI0012675A13|nr:uncharacterized protein LOC116176432 [Photinus pyralis]